MQLWLATLSFDKDVLSEERYAKALTCIDSTSQARVERFYRRQDAWRCVVGRLLPRIYMKRMGVAAADISFGASDAGKPHLTSPLFTPPLAFNISHDSGLVAMIVENGEAEELPFVGVDIMRVALPQGETNASFINVLNDQLTPLEVRLLSDPTASSEDTTLWLFVLWTFKEAYTKALGIGVGFDFRRIEFDFSSNAIRVDGEPLLGWEFRMVSFTLEQDNGDVQSEYQIAVARFVGGNYPSIVQWSKASEPLLDEWIVLLTAQDVVEQAEPLA